MPNLGPAGHSKPPSFCRIGRFAKSVTTDWLVMLIPPVDIVQGIAEVHERGGTYARLAGLARQIEGKAQSRLPLRHASYRPSHRA